jgi:hypothetical protein
MAYDLTTKISAVDAARLELLATEIEHIITPALNSGTAITIASDAEIQLRQLAASIRKQTSDSTSPLRLVA